MTTKPSSHPTGRPRRPPIVLDADASLRQSVVHRRYLLKPNHRTKPNQRWPNLLNVGPTASAATFLLETPSQDQVPDSALAT